MPARVRQLAACLPLLCQALPPLLDLLPGLFLLPGYPSADMLIEELSREA